MNHILNCGYEIKESDDPHSYERNFSNCVEKPAKIQDFNGIWAHVPAMPERRSNQLSYDDKDGAKWSFVVSTVPVMNESIEEDIKGILHFSVCEALVAF